MKTYDIIIIGAGASGLMAAGRFADLNIAIIESNPVIAKKVAISGGGRCNITNENVSSSNYTGDSEFISGILENFDQDDLLEFLKQRGLIPIIRKNGQYFCKDSANELINVLKKEIRDTPVFTNQTVQSVTKDKDIFEIKTSTKSFYTKKLVIATGGLSFSSIGASDLAYRVAKDFGHSIVTTKAALVGMTLQKDQFWMKGLSGISLDVLISVYDKSIRGDLLFAHKGISGPAVLNASLYWQKGQMEIDFLPEQKLDEKFFKSNKLISTALKLPKRFAKDFLDSINLTDKSLSTLDHKQKEQLKTIKSYSFAPAGNFGFTKAEVTNGGVCTDEIDSKTMMSKKCENLYFLGECLDVTGELGGYNFQWAFASAWRLGL